MCLPGIFRRMMRWAGEIAFEVAVSVGIAGQNKKNDKFDGVNALASNRNVRHRIKRKLQSEKGGIIMTGAETVIITGAAEATASVAGASSAVALPARACAEISSIVFCVSPSLSAFTTGVRSALPPPTG